MGLGVFWAGVNLMRRLEEVALHDARNKGDASSEEKIQNKHKTG